MPFPINPKSNHLFYRSDLDLWCYHTGTQWLTCSVFEIPGAPRTAMPVGTAEALDIGASATYARKLLSLDVSLYVLTPNNASNYWIATLVNAVNGTVYGTPVTTAAQAAGVWVTQRIDLSAVANVSVNLAVTLGKSGSPGSIYACANLRHRLVIT